MLKYTFKVTAVGAGLSLIAAVPTALSQQPSSRDDLRELVEQVERSLRNQIDEGFRRQDEKLKMQSDRILKIEREIEDARTEPRIHIPHPPPRRRIVYIHRYYHYYWYPPPWWW